MNLATIATVKAGGAPQLFSDSNELSFSNMERMRFNESDIVAIVRDSHSIGGVHAANNEFAPLGCLTTMCSSRTRGSEATGLGAAAAAVYMVSHGLGGDCLQELHAAESLTRFPSSQRGEDAPNPAYDRVTLPADPLRWVSIKQIASFGWDNGLPLLCTTRSLARLSTIQIAHPGQGAKGLRSTGEAISVAKPRADVVLTLPAVPAFSRQTEVCPARGEGGSLADGPSLPPYPVDPRYHEESGVRGRVGVSANQRVPPCPSCASWLISTEHLLQSPPCGAEKKTFPLEMISRCRLRRIPV
ncbi:hypothetical protein BDK51DRAFT_52664 [Blyttiomyces helicus]|uniref:Uncharacterized protein n=1 Tax=Blyttiomyces helicus TaxID=388810 RepID=A0A4P9WL92_9FUNG|nr:hypothetical protein BDK51DRAFT_52664 [Blyttiomyces helicus]|eukprot:RKO91396.1 hypothetical protein BDK51DRAFT_52664 [Blyttiomyces helicus]